MPQKKKQCSLGNRNCKLLFCSSTEILTHAGMENQLNENSTWSLWANVFLSEDGMGKIYCIAEGEYLYFWDLRLQTSIPSSYWDSCLWSLKDLSAVIHCLNALFCFVLCSRRDCGAPNGRAAFLLSAFVLEGFLTSQPKNTQALLLPRGKQPYRTEASMYPFQMRPVRRVWSLPHWSPSFTVFFFPTPSFAAWRWKIRARVQKEGGRR